MFSTSPKTRRTFQRSESFVYSVVGRPANEVTRSPFSVLDRLQNQLHQFYEGLSAPTDALDHLSSPGVVEERRSDEDDIAIDPQLDGGQRIERSGDCVNDEVERSAERELSEEEVEEDSDEWPINSTKIIFPAKGKKV
jgi:hypothetical protein